MQKLLTILVGIGLFLAVPFGVFKSDAVPPKLIAECETILETQSEQFSNKNLVIIIDYQRSILQKRLWVWNRKTQKVELHCRVSHAKNSGYLYPTTFSNTLGSKLSCTGIFRTGNTYKSSYGKGQYQVGMRITGLEIGKNNNALARNIVFHSGRVPFSEGCFMTETTNNKKIIDLTKNGGLVYVNY